MAATTITQSLERVRELLDAPTTSRWTDAQLKLWLSSALSTGQSEYHKNGGDRLDLVTTGSTSAVDGSLSIASVSPIVVKDVLLVDGANLWRIQAKNQPRRGYADLNARSLSVRYAREYELSSTDSHPLVGVGASAANTWQAFDDWIIAQAAWFASLKDAGQSGRPWLRAYVDECRVKVFARPNNPAANGWPRPEWSGTIADSLRWTWVPSSSTLYLVTGAW